jgi:hypothetical protein
MIFQNKKAAVELSIGTIVIIVLAMSMLILGIVLIKNIFGAANDIVDLTDQQLKDQVSKLFGDDKRLVMYPDTREITIKLNERGGFGFGIKNRILGTASQDVKFSYEVVVSDEDLRIKCGVTEQEVERWMVTGRAESGIGIPPGEVGTGKVLIQIPEGTSPCTFRLRVNVQKDSQGYATDIMDIVLEP